jgi:hypothetical protein
MILSEEMLRAIEGGAVDREVEAWGDFYVGSDGDLDAVRAIASRLEEVFGKPVDLDFMAIRGGERSGERYETFNKFSDRLVAIRKAGGRP